MDNKPSAAAKRILEALSWLSPEVGWKKRGAIIDAEFAPLVEAAQDALDLFEHPSEVPWTKSDVAEELKAAFAKLNH